MPRHPDDAEGMSSLAVAVPAARWRRLVGWFIDSTPFLLAALAWTRAIHGASAAGQLAHGLLTKNFAPALASDRVAGRLLAWTLGLLVGAAVFVCYRVGIQCRAGRTVGRWLTGTRLVTMDGRPLTSAHCWKRLGVVQGLGLFPLPGTGCLSAFWALCDPLRRTLADRGAGTRVVASR